MNPLLFLFPTNHTNWKVDAILFYTHQWTHERLIIKIVDEEKQNMEAIIVRAFIIMLYKIGEEKKPN